MHIRLYDNKFSIDVFQVCSRPFMTKSALNEHLRIHRNEKAFRCADCGKYFRHKHGLVTHQRNRKYPCSVKKKWENMCKTDTKVQHFRKVKSKKCKRSFREKNEKLLILYSSVKETQTACTQQNQSSYMYEHEINQPYFRQKLS